MPATIQIGPFRATITDYRWSSDTPELLALLNVLLDPTGPSGSDPNPDLTAAQNAANLLGGQIVAAEALDPPVEGRIY
jgi:hypothetical protein